jgi:hypothetical protein
MRCFLESKVHSGELVARMHVEQSAFRVRLIVGRGWTLETGETRYVERVLGWKKAHIEILE